MSNPSDPTTDDRVHRDRCHGIGVFLPSTCPHCGPDSAVIAQFFECGHLPARLRAIADMFRDVAYRVITNCPPSDERDHALRKLLEAKDCAVRSMFLSR